MSDPLNILVIDDDASFVELVARVLRGVGYGCHVTDGTAGADAVLAAHPIDLVVLDVDMPQESGIEFVKRLRCSRDVPVLMLSGLARESDRVNGLNAGADDYLVKPFGPDELIARVNALFRRIPSKPNRLAFGSWLFDRDAMRLTCAGQEVALTSAERALLRVLCENAGITLSRSRLLDLLGDPFGERFERSIDIRVARLRKLLNERSPPQWIRTIRGQGYCFWPDS